MKEIKKLLLAEESRLENIIKSTEKRLQNAPEGSLRLSSNQHGRMYYRYTDKKNYISKKETELVKALAQKGYDEKVLVKSKKILARIKALLKELKHGGINQIYLNEHLDRQKFIIPVEPTWEQKVEEWKRNTYVGLPFREDAPIILTEKGERVRSKSEKIIADCLYRNEIEYKYECPLYLNERKCVYPDFTIFSKKTGKEIYLEHLGMMDEPEYARKAINKLLTYEENGIYVGDSLILTYETEKTILSTQQLERLIKRYIL